MRKRPNDVEKLDKISQAINSDGQGNLTVSKNLGVDGKLTLKSLVSASNPDGDITKELGGSEGEGKLYCHCINFQRPPTAEKGGRITLNYFCKKQDAFTYQTFKALFTKDTHIACSGVVIVVGDGGSTYLPSFYIELQPRGTHEDLFVVHITKYQTYESAPIYT